MGIKIKSTIDFSKLAKEIEQSINKKIERNNMTLSKNHIRILEMLSQKGDCSTPPVGITDAQFYSCLKDMHGIYTFAAFVEGGKVCAARILDKGQAVLDDIVQELRDVLERRLELIRFDENEIAVWSWLADNKEHFDMPRGMDNDVFDAIMDDMIKDGMVKEPLSCDDGYKLTLKGKRQIEMWTQKEVPANMVPRDYQSAEKSALPTMKINKDCKTDIIKIFYAIQKCKLIVKEDGSVPTLEEIMDYASVIFNDESLRGKRYSSLLSEAAGNDKVTFLHVFDELRRKLEIYYQKAEEKRLNK